MMKPHLICFQEVEQKVCHNIIIKAQQFIDSLGDPRLDGVQADLQHVHLSANVRRKLELLEKLLLFVEEPSILLGACPLCNNRHSEINTKVNRTKGLA